MDDLTFFENTSIKIIENDVFASRKQISELYEVAESTLSDVIKQLKIDNLISGQYVENQVFTNNRKVLKNRKLEVFNLDSILAIGLRLRSEKAIKFQRWAINQLKDIIIEQSKEVKRAQLMESIAWNHLDSKDNFR